MNVDESIKLLEKAKEEIKEGKDIFFGRRTWRKIKWFDS